MVKLRNHAFFTYPNRERKMSNTKNDQGLAVKESELVPDFERWMRNVLIAVKSVRRWENKKILSECGFWGNKLNWARAFLFVPFFNFFVRLFSRLERFVDPWNATPENDLEHGWKQTMIDQKMLAIEDYHGNPHNLDYSWLLRCAPNHDLGESNPKIGDVNYHDKNKNKEYLEAEEKKAYDRIISSGVEGKYSIFFVCPINAEGQTDNSVEKEFWNISEHVGYCYFMMEEIQSGRLSKKEKTDFFLDITNIHLPLFRKYESKFISVRVILHGEFLPKYQQLSKMF